MAIEPRQVSGGGTCGKCGGPIAYYKLTSGKGKGKWCPCNPDGSDHWDICRENLNTGRYGVTKRFRASQGGARTKIHSLSRDKLYTGHRPPWEYDYMVYCVESETELRGLLAGSYQLATVKQDNYVKWMGHDPV